MSTIYEQLKKRRKALGLKQEDMILRVGMARQQYQRLESGGNPRLETLELVAKGLKMKLMLIPQDKLRAVHNVLEGKPNGGTAADSDLRTPPAPADDPWQGLLEDDNG